MNLEEFNNEFIQNLMEKLSFDRKNIYLIGDEMKIDSNNYISSFFDNMISNLLIPYFNTLNTLYLNIRRPFKLSVLQI